MKNSSCNFCGSSRLKADRALSGRIICMDCGRPIGLNSYSGRNTKSNKNDKEEPIEYNGNRYTTLKGYLERLGNSEDKKVGFTSISAPSGKVVPQSSFEKSDSA